MSIILVHLGSIFPNYINTCIQQIRLFNPEINIYLALHLKFKNIIKDDTVIIEDIDKINISEQHLIFNQKTNLNRNFKGGFWKFTTERFFYVNYLAQKYQLENIIHLENDNMIYFDIQHLMPTFNKYYNIGAVLDNDNRCIPSIMYFKNNYYTQKLINYIVDNINTYENDMCLIANMKNNTNDVNNLPIIYSDYNYEFKTPSGKIASVKENYYLHIEEFNSIFDAAAIGQYLGGVDPMNIAGDSRGFINESCVIDYSKVKINWETDNNNRKIPYLILKDKKYRINNLHIHCKRLHEFLSFS